VLNPLSITFVYLQLLAAETIGRLLGPVALLDRLAASAAAVSVRNGPARNRRFE
jgi:hypothetical protein